MGGELTYGKNRMRSQILKTIRFNAILFASLSAVSFFLPTSAWAEALTIFVPVSGDEKVVDLADDEVGELVVYLKSFGDIVGGFKITLLDDDDRAVGKSISDSHGLAKFSNIPPGRFRVIVERKMNDRGGLSTVSVGDVKVSKIRK